MKPWVLLFALLLSGCATGSGVKWFAPATWFSHAPADRVDKAKEKESEASTKAVKAAQKATHETALALAQAPDSRPVVIAAQSNDTALRLLDQVAGPLTTEESQQLRSVVNGLLSENAKIREAAEKERANSLHEAAKISDKLASTQQALIKANDNLRTAFERENALANELRSQRALFWIACAVAVLLGVGWMYVKVMYGGIPMAAGALMRDLRTKHPEAANVVGPLFDTYLSRREQDAISKHAR